jgi:hypothetical protein
MVNVALSLAASTDLLGLILNTPEGGGSTSV